MRPTGSSSPGISSGQVCTTKTTTRPICSYASASQGSALEPLPQFDAVAVGVADLGPGIGRADDRAPDDIDALLLQIVGGLLHVVDFEGDHAIAEMLALRSGIDGDAFKGDQLDDGSAKIEIDQTEGRAGPLNAVAGLHPEAQHLGIERFGLFRFIGDDLDVVDPLEHGSLAVVGVMLAFPRPLVGAALRKAEACPVRCMGFASSI